MSPLANWKTFVKAGDAVFTVENENTGNRLTFRVLGYAWRYARQVAQGDVWYQEVVIRV